MQEDHVVFETPELVRIDLELAGVGSRFLAGVVDSLLQTLVILGLGLALGLFRTLMTGDTTRLLTSGGILLFSSLLIIIAYYMIFELTWGGQSPGKRMAGLVVVRDDGGPIGLTESAVRNILRIVDLLPVYYTLGMISILVTRKCKRLGDLAAGTIVVKVRRYEAPEAVEPTESVPTALEQRQDPLVTQAMIHIASLSPQEVDTLRRFIERRDELTVESRRQVAERLAEGFRHRFPALQPQDVPSAEVFLDVLWRAWQTSRTVQ